MSRAGQRRPRRAARQRQARGASRVGERYDVVAGPIAHGGHVVARVAPADRVADPPADRVADPPADGRVANPRDDGRVADPPADGPVADPPADGPVANPPADGPVADPSADGRVANPSADGRVADPRDEGRRIETPETRVVFVRHALPGERVIVAITEGTDGDRFWRGDAVEVLEPSPDRVAPPCPYAGPGRCGGCDFQHVALAAQRELKADVVREQLTRLAGIDPDDPLVRGLAVEPVPGDADGLRWRTRQAFARTADGRRGMRRYRSHEVIPVDDCLIARPDAREPGHGTVTETVTVGGRRHDFDVAADGFWQVHPGAPDALVTVVLDQLDPRPGESVLDLYAGVGLFAAFLADRVRTDAQGPGMGPAMGPGADPGTQRSGGASSGRVVAIEGDARAAAYAAENVGSAEVTAGDVAAVLASTYDEPFDLVVLDPPREGARREVVEAVAARHPRAVSYVACDPAALARDVAIFAERGYRLRALRAFDLFPMTHHVECVALLTKTG